MFSRQLVAVPASLSGHPSLRPYPLQAKNAAPDLSQLPSPQELAGKAQGAADDVSGKAKGATDQAVGSASGAAEQAKGSASGAANKVRMHHLLGRQSGLHLPGAAVWRCCHRCKAMVRRSLVIASAAADHAAMLGSPFDTMRQRLCAFCTCCKLHASNPTLPLTLFQPAYCNHPPCHQQKPPLQPPVEECEVYCSQHSPDARRHKMPPPT